jgi:hypothetical protein
MINNDFTVPKNNIPVIYTPLVIYLVINVYFIYTYTVKLAYNKFLGRGEINSQ